MEAKISVCPQVPVRVYLVVQNRLLRETLVRLFQKQAGIDVAGEAAELRLPHGESTWPQYDVLLLDSLGAVYGTEVIDELKNFSCQRKVVLFGMDDEEQTFLKAIRLGVRGYLLKDASSTEIIAAIRGVADGRAVCPPKFVMVLFRCVAQEFRERAVIDDAGSSLKIGLTYRQRELIGLVAKGLTNKEIAAKLNLSEFTVKNHVHRIMRHVEAASRQEAVDFARARGLLPLA
jgi:DNA-binding NarL/FixJ family response regulator